MKRTLAALRRRIREELRAEGPDGAGYSSTFITDQINSAIQTLAEHFPIYDVISFTTDEGVNEYNLRPQIDDATIINITRVDYDGNAINPRDLTDLNQETLDEGEVKYWMVWGDKLLLFGEVEEKEVKMWITRQPISVSEDGDVPEIPEYADEAIAQYVIAACYRESLDYERASQHFRNFIHHEDRVRRRAIPQTQRAMPVHMRSFYFPPMSGRRGRMRSDDNPSGEIR